LFGARTYHLSRTIVIRHSDTTIQGSGPQTIFEYRANASPKHCFSDRVFTTSCHFFDAPPRHIPNAISIGDTAFTSADDPSDLQSGDWLLIADRDSVVGPVTVDWAQVDYVIGPVVHVRTPFRTAFEGSRDWKPWHQGLGFQRIVALVENTQFRDFTIFVPDAGPGRGAVGISVFGALHTTIDRVVSDSHGAQPLYSYVSKDVTITNSVGRGHRTLNEFASTVDLYLQGNRFAIDGGPGFGLNLGTGFFNVSGNDVDVSMNMGLYLMYGVHDGTLSGNRVAFVGASASNVDAFGILAWGTQNVIIADNYLAGGAGAGSVGISVRSSDGDIAIPSVNVKLPGNVFGSGWMLHYEAGTVPGN
jgi:hypothetical protein